MYKQSIFASLALAILSSNVIADEVSQKLDEVVITSKSDKKIEDLSSSVTVITAEEIAKMNATNIKDILVKQAGIIETVNSSPMNGRKGISIRGLDPSYSLILVDGKKINQSDAYIGHSDFQYSWVPINMIERIEVIKGPKSSIYGSQAIGGVINIITKKDVKEIYGEIDVQAGFSASEKGGDAENISANIGGNISDKLLIFAGASKFNRDYTIGSATPAFDHTYIEGVKNESGNIKLQYNFDDTQNVYASYLKGEEKRELELYPEQYKLKRDLYNVGYTKSFENISFDIDYAKTKLDSTYRGGSSSTMNYITKLTNDSIKGESKVTALKNNYIVIGAETSKETHDREYPMTGQSKWDYKARTNAYYLQDEIELGQYFILTLGGRYDDNEKYGSEFSPNIGAIYKIDDQQRLKVNYGEGFKAPTLLQGSSGYSSMGIWGNDDLKAETSESYELAYEFYGKDTIFKAAIFKTDLENMIKSEKGHNAISKYVNVYKVGTKGFELSADYDITENHMLNANYTYVKTEDKQTGNDLTYKPENTFNIGLTSKFGWGISSYLSVNYIGEQYLDSANTNKAGGYTIFNAQISKEITKGLAARIGVDNIGDKDFEEAEPYAIQRRFAYVGLNYKF